MAAADNSLPPGAPPMTTHTENRTMPYSAEEMYALIPDGPQKEALSTRLGAAHTSVWDAFLLPFVIVPL